MRLRLRLRLAWITPLLVRTALLLLSLVMATSVIGRIASMLLGELRRHLRCASGKIDVNSPRILLGGVLQPQFLADLLDTGFDLLNVIDRMISLSYDTVSHIF